MKIHREGYTILILFFILLAAVIIAAELLFPDMTVWHYIFYSGCLILAAFMTGFFRAPIREHDESSSILSPADGKIVVIEKVYDEEFFHDERLQVSIFMSPLNVHINWYPVSGHVEYYKYHPGRYLVAWHPKSSTDNERTTIVIKHQNQKHIMVRQIAGAVARRIVCYAKTGVDVKQGRELGFIKFGSRVDLLLPPDVEVNVGLNEKVVGKKTVIAHFRP